MQILRIVILCLLVASGSAFAADEGGEQEIKWYDKMDFGGSLRFRYEGFNWKDHFDDGRRDRFRFRLRFGFTMDVFESVKLGVELVGGNPDNPISDNQSLDGGFDKKTIALSQVYARWQASEVFTLWAGKFRPNGLWTATDIEWDDDINVEGAMQLLEWKTEGVLKEIGLNFYQFVLNESGDGIDSYMFGGQVVPVLALGEKNDLALGVGYEHFSNPTSVANLYFDEDLDIDSGVVSNFWDEDRGELLSEFRVASLFAEWKNKSIKNWPIKLTGWYFKNLGAEDKEGAILFVNGDTLATGNPKDNDAGLFVRLQVGDYKKPGQVAIRATRYDSKPDAMFFAYAQSDTRRASNVDGYRADLRIGMPKKGHVNLTWYHTNWSIGDDSTMDRWQADYIFRF